MTSNDPRPYLTAHLDQITAANTADDEPAAITALARIIDEDHPSARAAIADALHLAAARDQPGSIRDDA